MVIQKKQFDKNPFEKKRYSKSNLGVKKELPRGI
jgi:hypothetical protein